MGGHVTNVWAVSLVMLQVEDIYLSSDLNILIELGYILRDLSIIDIIF